MALVLLLDQSSTARGLSQEIDALRERLFASGLNVYVFIDPLLDSPLLRSPKRGDEHIISLESFGVQKHQSPYFLLLENSASILLDETYRLAKDQANKFLGPRSICGWFVSECSTADIRKALWKEMDRREGSGGAPWLFRFYDPRTLCRLPDIFKRNPMIHGVAEWWCLDERAQLFRCAGAPLSEGPSPIALGDLKALDGVSLVNQAYSQWKAIAEPPADAFKHLFDAVQCAMTVGLNVDEQADCVSFMLHRCLVHPQIERHAVVRGWLDDARQGINSYADAAASAAPALWQEIESGQWMRLEGVKHG